MENFTFTLAFTLSVFIAYCSPFAFVTLKKKTFSVRDIIEMMFRMQRLAIEEKYRSIQTGRSVSLKKFCSSMYGRYVKMKRNKFR